MKKLELLITALSLVTMVVAQTCTEFTTCTACLTTPSVTNCGWCMETRTCSTGTASGPDSDICQSWVWLASAVTNTTTSGTIVSPTRADITLRKGQTLDVVITVRPQPIPLDIYVLEDLTSTFADDDNMVTLMADVKSKLQSNTYFGLGGFTDKAVMPMGFFDGCACSLGTGYSGCSSSAVDDTWHAGCYNYAFKPLVSLSDNSNAMINALNNALIRGNYDTNEASAEAMVRAALCKDLVGWRDGAMHIMLISTDAPYHLMLDGYPGGMHHALEMECIPKRRPVRSASKYPAAPGSGEDYPSVGMVKAALLKENIIPVFAIVDARAAVPAGDGINPYPFFVDLVQRLGIGSIARLEENSAHIYDIIEDAYIAASSKIQTEVQSDNGLFVQEVINAYIEGVVTDGTVPYNVTVRLKAIESSASNNITIQIMGMGTVSLIVNVVDKCECGVECPDNCNGHGSCDCGACTCEYPFTSDACDCDTSVACVPAGCNGQSRCLCGVCQCLPGWTDDVVTGGLCNCSTQACPTAEIGQVCSGHGTCNCGACDCASGYTGSDCNCIVAECPTSTVGLNCSGNGVCECGSCICNPGYKYDDCSCIDFVCPNNCSGIGVCGCGGVCSCPDGYSGDFCECYVGGTCPGNCTYALGHGECGCGGVCACSAGWKGLDCNCSALPCPNDCSGHGNCDCGVCDCENGWLKNDCSCDPNAECTSGCVNGTCTCGVCVCDPYFTGANCSCYNVPCPGNCFEDENHGVCNCGTCECTGSWTGPDCGCNPDTVCLNNCNNATGNGVCECGVCKCAPEYSGEDCGCHDVPCENNCYESLDHGTCVCGVCQCKPEYTKEPDCSCLNTATCPDNCMDIEGKAHGNCSCSTCICFPGWMGDNCLCDSRPCIGDNNCSYPNGECKCGVCDCGDDWTGDTCNCLKNVVCDPAINCTGHGTCGCNGTCDCDPGWEKSDCSCKNIPCVDDCNGRGECVCGICACNASLNYGGEYCECSLSAVCPDNCTDEAHGTCQCGVCECKNGYEGANCNCSSLPCPNACSGNGDCLCSECHCAEGWAGADCACDLDLICPDCVHGSCCNYTSLGDSCLTSACGSCVCEQGWTGTLCDCSVAACPYNCHEHGECVCGECQCTGNYSKRLNCECEESTCVNDCSGHGTCKCGVCLCNSGWMANPDGTQDCSCEDALCLNDCSNNGDCECGVCKCHDGWAGDDCACTTAACPSNCTVDDHGYCCDPAALMAGICMSNEQCGTCICNPGYSHDPYSSVQDCSCSSNSCPGDCHSSSGKGTCSCAACICNEPWTGDDCACNKTVTCPDNCIDSTHGTCCSATTLGESCPTDKCGVCICNSLWSGDNCNCSTTSCPNNCSYADGHGECVCGKCQCKGVWGGESCACNTTNVCKCENPAYCCVESKYGKGGCTESSCGACICPPSFTNEFCNCSTKECLRNCSYHGSCTCGKCVCDSDYTYDDCSCPIVPDCSALGNCHGNGDCKCTSCVCHGAFTGPGCELCVGNDTYVCPGFDPCEAASTCEECFDAAITGGNNCTYCDGLCRTAGKQGGCLTSLPQCAETPIDYQTIATVGGTVISGMVAAAVAFAAIIKMWQRKADMKEWREFEASQAAMRFGAKENVLFRNRDGGDVRTKERINDNPLYEEDATTTDGSHSLITTM